MARAFPSCATLLLCVSPLYAQDARIVVHADQPRHHLSRYLTGACIEDVNHEIYGGLYSQMIFGESFQEPPGKDHRTTGPQDHRTTGPQDRETGLSGMWRAFRTGSAEGGFSIETNAPFVGKQSQTLVFSGGEGEMGLSNRGLNGWGMAFAAGKTYEGCLWARAPRPATIYVRLENGDGQREYAETALRVTSSVWERLDFRLKPGKGSGQAGRLPYVDEAGRFAISLKAPGEVCIGYAFLQPSARGRFKGLPVRRDVAEALVAQGITVLRYGGSMVNHTEYRWKNMIGPRERRPPYHGTWYPYSSNGWGIFDFLNFCETAGFLGIPAVYMHEGPQSIADFIEYANGPAVPGEGTGPTGPSAKTWAARRAADGHPRPYGLKYIELGNEEAVNDDYWRRFKPMAEAIWAKDPNIILVVGDFAYDKAFTDPYNFTGAPRIKSMAVHKKILDLAREHGREVWFDVHIGTEQPPAPYGLPGVRSFIEELAKLSPGAKYKVAIFEFNAGNHAMKRALANACAIVQIEQSGDRIPIACSANCLQPYKQNDNGWNQGLLFLSPAQVWPQPPYFVTQMVSQNYLPLLVRTDLKNAQNSDALEVAATRSEDGKSLVLQVVNIAATPVSAQITLQAFSRRKLNAQETVLAGDWEGTNTPEQPDHVHPTRTSWRWDSDGSPITHSFPARSFTIIRFD